MRSSPAIRDAAKLFFRPYLAMVRPISFVAGPPPKGTIEDGQAMAAFGSSGTPFGVVVFIRVGNDFNAVLLPAFVHDDSAAAYHDFLHSDKESLRLTKCQFDVQNGQWHVAPDSEEMHWPKADSSLRFD